LVVLRDGKLTLGQEICVSQAGKTYEIKEIGILHPSPTPLKTLYVFKCLTWYFSIASKHDA